jgi:hypothetical protein
MALASLVVALFAAVLSAVAFWVNLKAANAAERRGRMPVLVTRHAHDSIGVVNVGNGPALNIVIAQAIGRIAAIDVSDANPREHHSNDTWKAHKHLAQIPSEAEHWYEWSWAETAAVGLTYTDALGHHYTALSSPYGTKVVDGFEMPHPSLETLDYPKAVDAPAHS